MIQAREKASLSKVRQSDANNPTAPHLYLSQFPVNRKNHITKRNIFQKPLFFPTMHLARTFPECTKNLFKNEQKKVWSSILFRFFISKSWTRRKLRRKRKYYECVHKEFMKNAFKLILKREVKKNYNMWMIFFMCPRNCLYVKWIIRLDLFRKILN